MRLCKCMLVWLCALFMFHLAWCTFLILFFIFIFWCNVLRKLTCSLSIVYRCGIYLLVHFLPSPLFDFSINIDINFSINIFQYLDHGMWSVLTRSLCYKKKITFEFPACDKLIAWPYDQNERENIHHCQTSLHRIARHISNW